MKSVPTLSTQHRRTKAVDLVLVGYREADVLRSLKFCNTTLAGGPIRRRLLVLNEPSLRQRLQAGSSWEVLDGSNKLGEFSGWQEALNVLDDQSAGVVFTNDTVCTHRWFSRSRKAGFAYSVRFGKKPSFVGFRDRGDGRLQLAGMPLVSWASTYCFALDTAALARLNRTLYEPALVAECVPGGCDEDRFFANMSPDLDAHLRWWMFGGGWPAGERLSEQNRTRLTFKARCVIAELALSARCDQVGIQTLDPFAAYSIFRRLDKLEYKLKTKFRT